MAEVNSTPVQNPARGISALERDLPVVLRGATLQGSGWSQPDALTLFVPMWSLQSDFYLLRLQFHCYPEWPPSAQFVNPITREYRIGHDLNWLPKIEAPHLHVHPDYADQKKQLICNSSTLEFYEVRHGLDNPDHIWKEASHNFGHTVNTISLALRGEFYKGRHA